jgi:hypothetical protein
MLERLVIRIIAFYPHMQNFICVAKSHRPVIIQPIFKVWENGIHKRVLERGMKKRRWKKIFALFCYKYRLDADA